MAYDTILTTDLISDSRTKITNRDDFVRSNAAGVTEPPTMIAGMTWIDLTNGLEKRRNSTNTAWITVGEYATNMGHRAPTTATAKSFDVKYQNASTRKILVVAYMQTTISGSALSGVSDAGNNDPPTVQVARATGNPDYGSEYVHIAFVVPPSYYWKVVTTNKGGGASSLETWEV